MAKRISKITIKAYDQEFKFNARNICGYVKCDKLKKVISISPEAHPYIAKNGISFLCQACGKYTHESAFNHTLIYKGKEIKYGY